MCSHMSPSTPTSPFNTTLGVLFSCWESARNATFITLLFCKMVSLRWTSARSVGKAIQTAEKSGTKVHSFSRAYANAGLSAAKFREGFPKQVTVRERLLAALFRKKKSPGWRQIRGITSKSAACERKRGKESVRTQSAIHWILIRIHLASTSQL